jgi:hypothetical protein
MNVETLKVTFSYFHQMETKTEAKSTLTLEEVLVLTKEFVMKKDQVSEMATQLAKMIPQWEEKALPVLRRLISEARANLKVGDQVFFPVAKEEEKLWQIREVEKIADRNHGKDILIKWKKFDILVSGKNEKLVQAYPKELDEEECITMKLIPLSVVQGNVESFKMILQAVYPRNTNFLIL